MFVTVALVYVFVAAIRRASASLRAEGERIVSVVVVLSPGYLSVWAPKEELRGLLALLEGGEHAPGGMSYE